MKTKAIAAALTAALILAAGGCRETEIPADAGASEPAFSQSEAPPPPEPASAGPETTPSSVPADQPEAASVKVSIDRATDELLAGYASIHEYINDEDGDRLMIRTDAEVRNFAFITVRLDGSGDTLSYLAGDTLFSADKLSPEKPFVVELLIPGSMPAYGISFEDEDGTDRYYTINLSGRGEEEAPAYFLLEFENGLGLISPA